MTLSKRIVAKLFLIVALMAFLMVFAKANVDFIYAGF